MSIPMSNNIFIALHNIYSWPVFNTKRNWLCLNPFTNGYIAALYIYHTRSGGPTIMYPCVLYIYILPVSLYHIHASIIIHVYTYIITY